MGEKKFLLGRSFTFNNTFLKNEARTQKYFSNMALEQKSLATPALDDRQSPGVNFINVL